MMSPDTSVILEALKDSNVVEIQVKMHSFCSDFTPPEKLIFIGSISQGELVRKKDDWDKWLLPPPHVLDPSLVSGSGEETATESAPILEDKTSPEVTEETENSEISQVEKVNEEERNVQSGETAEKNKVIEERVNTAVAQLEGEKGNSGEKEKEREPVGLKGGLSSPAGRLSIGVEMSSTPPREAEMESGIMADDETDTEGAAAIRSSMKKRTGSVKRTQVSGGGALAAAFANVKNQESDVEASEAEDTFQLDEELERTTTRPPPPRQSQNSRIRKWAPLPFLLLWTVFSPLSPPFFLFGGRVLTFVFLPGKLVSGKMRPRMRNRMWGTPK